MRLWLPLILSVWTVFSVSGVPAADKSGLDGDTKAYLEAVQVLKDQPVDTQIDGWHKFLREHPDTQFREEIERNVKTLEDLLSNTDPIQIKEKKDTERYLRAAEYARKLTAQDQILLWEQFLEENPQSIYRRETQRNLDELRGKYGKPETSPPTAPVAPEREIRVAPDLRYKDTQKAVLLATFPGLIVPGMAHWYVNEYVVAGILLGLRVAGLGVGIPGIIGRNTPAIVGGAVLAGFSYLADIVDAPFAVQRYNDRLEKAKGISFLEGPLLVSFRY